MRTWALQDAKSKFSQVVEEASSNGPQIVTKRGKEAAVILSFEDFCNLSNRKGSLVDFFRNSPLSDTEFSIERSEDLDREIEL